jgi:predicted SAM-dependent methyltransferase
VLKQLLKSRLSGGVRLACRKLLLELRIQQVHRRSIRRARCLTPPLELHIGCGTDLKPGWVNVDLFEETADLRLDLRELFPFPTASVTIIHSEHFLEHLDFPDEVEHVLRESYRVLVPHGVFSVGIPEAGGLMAAYGRGEQDIFAAEWNPNYPEWLSIPMHRINYLFRQFGEHKYAYDEETLLWTLRRAGFEKVSRRPFDPAMDTERRRSHTMYASGIKPAH